MQHQSCQLKKLSVLIFFYCLLALVAPTSLFAKDASGSNNKGSLASTILDQKKVHAMYFDGDFDKVIATIDTFTHANKTFSKSDSIFIAKHLSVIYSANPATLEKGKNYMFRLLSLVPSARIVDMFVSVEIDRIFERMKEEYEIKQSASGEEPPTKLESSKYAANKMTVNESAPVRPLGNSTKEKPKSSNTMYWVAGGVTVIAIAGTAAYFLQAKPREDKVYGVPK